MGPRYDANYDALQCAARNGTACPNCANRIEFIGRRGEKGAWNKPCKGIKRPDLTGHGRKRCTYGGCKTRQHDLEDVLQAGNQEAVGQAEIPSAQCTAVRRLGIVSALPANTPPNADESSTCDIDWFNMAE